MQIILTFWYNPTTEATIRSWRKTAIFRWQSVLKMKIRSLDFRTGTAEFLTQYGFLLFFRFRFNNHCRYLIAIEWILFAAVRFPTDFLSLSLYLTPQFSRLLLTQCLCVWHWCRRTPPSIQNPFTCVKGLIMVLMWTMIFQINIIEKFTNRQTARAIFHRMPNRWRKKHNDWHRFSFSCTLMEQFFFHVL